MYTENSRYSYATLLERPNPIRALEKGYLMALFSSLPNALGSSLSSAANGLSSAQAQTLRDFERKYLTDAQPPAYRHFDSPEHRHHSHNGVLTKPIYAAIEIDADRLTELESFRHRIREDLSLSLARELEKFMEIRSEDLPWKRAIRYTASIGAIPIDKDHQTLLTEIDSLITENYALKAKLAELESQQTQPIVQSEY